MDEPLPPAHGSELEAGANDVAMVKSAKMTGCDMNFSPSAREKKNPKSLASLSDARPVTSVRSESLSGEPIAPEPVGIGSRTV